MEHVIVEVVVIIVIRVAFITISYGKLHDDFSGDNTKIN